MLSHGAPSLQINKEMFKIKGGRKYFEIEKKILFILEIDIMSVAQYSPKYYIIFFSIV